MVWVEAHHSVLFKEEMPPLNWLNIEDATLPQDSTTQRSFSNAAITTPN